MAARAWRALKQNPLTEVSPQWTLLAGLTAALWVFWMDVQINVPVPTTRLVSFALAALILVIAARIQRHDAVGMEAGESLTWRAFGIACAGVATIGICISDGMYDTSTNLFWLRRTGPILALSIVAAAAILVYATRRTNYRDARRAAATAALPPLIYLLAQFALIACLAEQIRAQAVGAISIASLSATALIGLLCVAFAWWRRRAENQADPTPLTGLARIGIGFVLAVALMIASVDWQTRRAEVAFTLALQLSAKDSELSERLMEDAIRLRPYERYYQRQLARVMLTHVVESMQQLATVTPQSHQFRERLDSLLRQLAAAETAARAGAAMFPRDPWMVGTLANVLQFKALRALRALDPEGSIRAAREADQLFGRAHRIYPTDPLLLRNWGQFLAEQGLLDAAYAAFDRMEVLIPEDIAPYAARLEAAREAHDAKAVEETLARASKALEPIVFKELLLVAKAQQSP
jgi:hypothetical protein